MKEINVIINKLKYPLYIFERIIIWVYATVYCKVNKIELSSITYNDVFPYYLRQFDEVDPTYYYDDFFRSSVQLSIKNGEYKGKRYFLWHYVDISKIL